MLSQRSVRLLATCGWREWRRHIEPDPGLARRLAAVRMAEPDDATSVTIVEGLRPRLAEHHGVEISEEAIGSAVALSRRYIAARRLPDKAVATLDSACARARAPDLAPTPGGDGPDGEAARQDAAAAESTGSDDDAPRAGGARPFAAAAHPFDHRAFDHC